MPLRKRGPGLARTVVRTAAISGTATATSNAVNRRAMERHQPTNRPAEVNAQAPEPQEIPEDLVTTLIRLGELHTNGILTDEEFAAAKAKVLS